MEYKLTYKEYSEALKQNKLMGLKCQSCGTVTVPPKMVCRSCASPELEVLELKGAGRIQTFTTCNVAAEGRESEVPYIILHRLHYTEMDVEFEEHRSLYGEQDAIVFDGIDFFQV